VKTAMADLNHAQLMHKAAQIRMTWTPRVRRRRSAHTRDMFRRFAQLTLGARSEEIWAVGALTDADLRRLARP
jgi:hypothetical protein